MGLLDGIMKQVAGAVGAQGGLGAIAELAMKNPKIVTAALALLNPKDTSVGGGSGLFEMIGAFDKGGLGDVMSSWVGGGPNKPVDAGALERVLGADTLGQFAQKAGIKKEEAGSTLASVLPTLVNQLTPDGKMPDAGAFEGVLGSLVGQLTAR